MPSYLVGNVMDDVAPAIWDCDDKLDVIDRLLTEWVRGDRDLAGTVSFAYDHGANTGDLVEMAEEEQTEILETIAFFIVSLLTQKPWLVDAYLEMVAESVIVVEMKEKRRSPSPPLPTVMEEPNEVEEE